MSANLHIKPVNLANGDLTADDVDLETCSNVATACGPIVSDNCMSALNLHQVQGSDTILTEDIKMETENVKEQTPQVKMEVGSFKPEHPAPCSVSLGTPLDEEFCINQVVWAIWGCQKGRDPRWYPAVIVEVDADKTTLLWLGDGRVSYLLEADAHAVGIRDFCQNFAECYPTIGSNRKYKMAAKLCAKLAAVHAQEDFPDEEWDTWAMDNMVKYHRLLLSDRFYFVGCGTAIPTQRPICTEKELEQSPAPKCAKANKGKVRKIGAKSMVIRTKHKAKTALPPDVDKLKVPLDQDWIRLLSKRCTGATAGTFDVYYWPPDRSKKLRSIPDVIRFLQTRAEESDEFSHLTETNFSFNSLIRIDHEQEKTHDAAIRAKLKPAFLTSLD